MTRSGIVRCWLNRKCAAGDCEQGAYELFEGDSMAAILIVDHIGPPGEGHPMPVSELWQKQKTEGRTLPQGKFATAANPLGFHVLAWTVPLEATPQPLPAKARTPNHFAQGRCRANTPRFGAGRWIWRSSHQCAQSRPRESAAPQLPGNQWDARILLR